MMWENVVFARPGSIYSWSGYLCRLRAPVSSTDAVMTQGQCTLSGHAVPPFLKQYNFSRLVDCLPLVTHYKSNFSTDNKRHYHVVIWHERIQPRVDH